MDETGCAVRRDWPNGSHELVGFTTDKARARRFITRDRGFWRHGPVRPVSWQIVVVSRRDFDLHAGRHGCRAPDCPQAEGPIRPAVRA
jgi:hypothetical protein